MTRFSRAARVIGDLDSRFYDEERQRDVWNEASAVGLQVVLFAGTAAAAAMIWLGEETALPYAFTVFALVGLAAFVVLALTRQAGVDPGSGARVWRLRLAPFLALQAFFFVGVFRALPPDGFTGGVRWGLIVGAGAAVLGVLCAARRRTGD